MPAALGEPPLRLIGYEKVKLAAGESKRVKLKLKLNSARHLFSYFDDTPNTGPTGLGEWKIAPGDFRVLVGPSSRPRDFATNVDVIGADEQGFLRANLRITNADSSDSSDSSASSDSSDDSKSGKKKKGKKRDRSDSSGL